MGRIRDACQSRGITGRAYYDSMAEYRRIGELSNRDRLVLKTKTDAERREWCRQKYGTYAVGGIALADYDTAPDLRV